MLPTTASNKKIPSRFEFPGSSGDADIDAVISIQTTLRKMFDFSSLKDPLFSGRGALMMDLFLVEI